MKRIFFCLAMLPLLLSSCVQNPETVIVDKKAEAAAINEVITTMYSVFETKEISLVDSLLTDNVLMLGTDPGEFFTRQETIDLYKQLAEGPVPDFKFIRDREIRVADDGNSAIVVDQYESNMFTPNIPWRNVISVVKINNQWKIDFMSSALIPANEDIQKLNDALNPES
jgi:hypothetical protein